MSRLRLNIGSYSLVLGLLTWAASHAAACSGYVEQKAAESTFSIVQGSKQAMQRTTDIEFARLATPGGLVQLEAFHLAYPKHRGFLSLLAEGYCQYAVGFVYPAWETSVLTNDAEHLPARRHRTLSALQRCHDLGLDMLGKRWKNLQTIKDWSDALQGAKKKHVPGLTWVALGMANTIAVDPLKAERLRQLKITEAILDTIVELDEGHNDAFAHLMLGALASSRPRLLGGNPEKGRQHFERARELVGPGFLMIDVLFARTYLVSKKAREEFRNVLNAVIVSNTAQWPDRALANAIAKETARSYLAAEKTLFGSLL